MRKSGTAYMLLQLRSVPTNKRVKSGAKQIYDSYNKLLIWLW